MYSIFNGENLSESILTNNKLVGSDWKIDQVNVSEELVWNIK